MQVPQYQTAQMMPMEPMQPMVNMPISSPEERARIEMEMAMSGLNPDDFTDRLRFMGNNAMGMPARIMEAPGAIGKKAKKQAKGLLDLFK